MNEPLQVNGEANEAYRLLKQAHEKLSKAKLKDREESRKRNILFHIETAIKSRYWSDGDE